MGSKENDGGKGRRWKERGCKKWRRSGKGKDGKRSSGGDIRKSKRSRSGKRKKGKEEEEEGKKRGKGERNKGRRLRKCDHHRLNEKGQKDRKTPLF